MIFYDRIPLGGADIQSTKLAATSDIHGKKTKSYEMHIRKRPDILAYPATVKGGMYYSVSYTFVL